MDMRPEKILHLQVCTSVFVWLILKCNSYERCRPYTGVNLLNGMDFYITVRPVWPVDSVVCNVLQSNVTNSSCKKLCVTTENMVTLVPFSIRRDVTFPMDKFDSDTAFSSSMLLRSPLIVLSQALIPPYETDAGSVKLSLHLRHRFLRHFPEPVLMTKKKQRRNELTNAVDFLSVM